MLGNMLLCIGYRGYIGYMKDEIYWIYFIYKRLKAAHSDVGQYVVVYWISGIGYWIYLITQYKIKSGFFRCWAIYCPILDISGISDTGYISDIFFAHQNW